MKWLVRIAIVIVLAIVGLGGFLWIRADRDLAYVLRVLHRRQSHTNDYDWKAIAPVAPSPQPIAWRDAPACPAARAAFAQDPDATDLDSYLTRGGALALVVVRDGAIACEWYGNGGARDKYATAFSISKTIVSLLISRAVADGSIASLDMPITAFAPALLARDPRFSAITLAELLDMRSGIAFEDDPPFPWVDQDAALVYFASDLAHNIVAKPRIESPPGPFLYNDYAPNLNGLALQQASGKSLATATQALWNAIGAESAAGWLVDAHGYAWHESGLLVTARDLARVGELMLDDSRGVAPPAYLARSFDPIGRARVATFGDVEVGYRNGWWIFGDRGIVAMGRFGQIMVVSPKTHTVIVRLGLDGHEHDETNAAIASRLLRIAERLTGTVPPAATN